MKCQHCGSINTVIIQGQNYCLNCGHVVTAPAEAPTEEPKSPARTSKKRVVASAATTPGDVQDTGAPAAVGPGQPKRQIDLPSKPERSPAHMHPLRFSLLSALGIGGGLGLLTWLALWLQVETDIALYVLTGAILAGLVAVSLSQSALLYGASRYLDKRQAPHTVWWAAARSGFMDVVNVLLVTIIVTCLLAVVVVGAWRGINLADQLSMPFRVVILCVVNGAVAWVLLGVYTAKRLAVPAIVIGGTTAWQGLKVGFHLYRKAGGHLLAGVLEVIICRLIVLVVLLFALRAIIVTLPPLSDALIAISTGAVVAIAAAVGTFALLEIESRIWLRHYRHWVCVLDPRTRVRLLTGRILPHGSS